MSVKFTILGSGSSGNCAYVETAETRILVDSQRPSDIALPIIPSAARAGAKFGARCGGAAVSILSPE